MLRLATSLRDFAADASPDYTRKMLHAAAELEARAEFLAEHRADETPSDPKREAALHAPVDLQV